MTFVKRAARVGAATLRRLKRSVFNSAEERRVRAALAAVAAFPTTPRPRARPALPRELIVSLTSYPPRFRSLTLTVKSLLDQTIEARVILWIAKDHLTELPPELATLRQPGLEIRDCADLRSYKKIIPALQAYPDAYIVTADDDLYYPANWLEQIVEGRCPDDKEIIGLRGHIAKLRADGSAFPYSDWELETQKTRAQGACELLFLTGGAGTLYPPGSLHPEVTNADVFMDLCPTADDVWLFCMAEMQGTPRRRLAARTPLIYWPGSQDGGLLTINVDGGANDLQLAAVQKHYGLSLAPGHTQAAHLFDD